MGVSKSEMLGFCPYSDFYHVCFTLKETHNDISDLSLALKLIIASHVPLSGKSV